MRVMSINQVKGIKVSILPQTYVEVLSNIMSSENPSDIVLADKVRTISNLEDNELENLSALLAESTLDLYLMGFKASEISGIRDVSRQAVTNKLNLALVSLDEACVKEHTENRQKLQEIVTEYYVRLCEETKDLALMRKVLSKQYKTNRSQFLAFVSLGGSPNTFAIDEVDKRFTTVTGNDKITKIFELFDKGVSNATVSETLSLTEKEVIYYKKKYYRFNDSTRRVQHIANALEK